MSIDTVSKDSTKQPEEIEGEMKMEINILLPTNLVEWTHTKYIIDTSAAGCIATTLRDVDEYTSPGLNRIPIICYTI